MREAFFEAPTSSGPCRISYTDWGAVDNPDVVLCVHGLTRNSRDFDALAQVLSEKYRVMCLDVPGRGTSDWLANPADYTYPTYCRIICDFLSDIGAPEINWIGTSMGGIIGMMIAALPKTPIKKMVINDVGPFIPKSALKRIAAYLALDINFNSKSELEQNLREIHAPFGPLTDAQWAHLAEHGSRQDEQGRWRFKYDPKIAVPFKDASDEDIAFWEVWDAIKCPVLLLRGEVSDLLRHETAKEMTQRGPRTDLVEFADIGHAPSLMASDQIETIKKWLS